MVNKKEIFVSGMMMICLIGIGIFGTLAYQEWNSHREIPLSENENCFNLEFEETINCLNNEVRSFHNYNSSNKELYWNNGRREVEDWDRIKSEGGVCWHYAEYYIMRAKELGLEGYYKELRGDNLNHAVAVISDENKNYCVLDQTKIVGCNKLREDENE